MKDGLAFEEMYMAEVGNFATPAARTHANIMTALLLKQTLADLYAARIVAEETPGLDDDEADLRDVSIVGFN
jgi:hypothetical protein